MPHNIDRSAFRRGEYVGYGAGTVSRIVRMSGGWFATARDYSAAIHAPTLSEVSSQIEAHKGNLQ